MKLPQNFWNISTLLKEFPKLNHQLCCVMFCTSGFVFTDCLLALATTAALQKKKIKSEISTI